MPAHRRAGGGDGAGALPQRTSQVLVWGFTKPLLTRPLAWLPKNIYIISSRILSAALDLIIFAAAVGKYTATQYYRAGVEDVNVGTRPCFASLLAFCSYLNSFLVLIFYSHPLLIIAEVSSPYTGSTR